MHIDEETSPRLEDITGIGGTFAARLRQAGIGDLRDVESATPERLAEICGCPVRRVIAQDWIAQAASLVSPVTAAGGPTERPPERLHFTVEVSANPSTGAIHSTRITHVQGPGEPNVQAGWDAADLVRFIESRLPGTRPAGAPDPGTDMGLTERDTRPPVVVHTPVMIVPGRLPTHVEVRLDPTEVEAHQQDTAQLSIAVYASSVPRGRHQLVGSTTVPFDRAPSHRIAIEALDHAFQPPLGLLAVIECRTDDAPGIPLVVASASADLQPA